MKLDNKDLEEDWARIDEMNNRPEGYPPLTIEEAMRVYNQTIYFGQSRLEDKIDDLRNRLEELRQDSKVKEYIEIKNDIDFLASAHVPLDSKTAYLQKRMCSHPLLGVLNRHAVCTVCGTSFDYTPEELQELLDSKKLVAASIKTYPIKKAPLKEIREYYLEQYSNSEGNVEEQVWDHFCGKEIIETNPKAQKTNHYWYDEELYGMDFESFCNLDDDVRHKLIEEKTGKKITPDTDIIWIGGNPYLGIKTMEDVDEDFDALLRRLEQERREDPNQPSLMMRAKQKLKQYISGE